MSHKRIQWTFLTYKLAPKDNIRPPLTVASVVVWAACTLTNGWVVVLQEVVAYKLQGQR